VRRFLRHSVYYGWHFAWLVGRGLSAASQRTPILGHPGLDSHSVGCDSSIFIARELMFTFAICCRPSVCLSSVTFLHPTQPVKIFGKVSMPVGTLAILWRPRKILRRSSHSQGNPSVGELNEEGQPYRIWTYRRLYLRNGGNDAR